MCYIVNTSLTNLPIEFKKILEGIKDIFSKKVPQGMLGHQIDFTLRTSMTSTNNFALGQGHLRLANT
ncbi:hypothetical protein CR513_16500, partial [Mucuna pruriens]